MAKVEVIDFLTSKGFVLYYRSTGGWYYLKDAHDNHASVSPDHLTLMLAGHSHIERYDFNTLEVVNDHLYVRVAPEIFN